MSAGSIGGLAVLISLAILESCWGIAIDNGVVGQPSITCEAESIRVSVNAQNSFRGRIFVKGFSEQAVCSQAGDGRTQQTFSVGFDRCGVRRTREVNPPGLSISVTVIVSFHSIFLTKVDRAYRVSCFYMEATKSVSQNIDVSMLTTIPINEGVPMPVCRYEILRGDATGPPVQFARIGEPVYHKWSCDATVADVYCMRVHTCTVDDGQGGQTITVLDENGCSVDKFVLPNLDYTSDMMAGQEAHVFKFADRPALFFNCQVELRLKEVHCARPACGEPSVDPTPATRGPYGVPNSRRRPAISQPSVDRPYVTSRQIDATPRTTNRVPRPPVATPPYANAGFRSTSHHGTRNRRAVPESWMKSVKETSVVADFDLPSRQLVVFDLDDSATSSRQTGDESFFRRPLGGASRGGIDVALSHDSNGAPRSESFCMPRGHFMATTVAVLALFAASVAFVLVACFQRRGLLDEIADRLSPMEEETLDRRAIGYRKR